MSEYLVEVDSIEMLYGHLFAISVGFYIVGLISMLFDEKAFGAYGLILVFTIGADISAVNAARENKIAVQDCAGFLLTSIFSLVLFFFLTKYAMKWIDKRRAARRSRRKNKAKSAGHVREETVHADRPGTDGSR